MTFKEFDSIINIIWDMYSEKVSIDQKFEKVFGGDSQIYSSFFDKQIEDLISILVKSLKDKDSEWIDYLIYEVGKDKKYEISDGKEKFYANTKSIWYFLTGEKIKGLKPIKKKG